MPFFEETQETMFVPVQEPYDGSNASSNGAGEEEIPAFQARALLGISNTRFAQLLKEWETTREGGLPFRVSPLDHRVHLIKRRDVDALLQASQGKTVEEARRDLGVSTNKILALIQGGQLLVRPNPLNLKQRLVDPESFAALLAERRPRLM